MQTVSDRFWAKVERTETCWLWTASLTRVGYGRFKAGGKTLGAHRWAYEHEVGPIPEGMQIDHLCRVRHCVRPDHLEPVQQPENMKRAYAIRTTCPQGHPHDKLNHRGHRMCSICAAAAVRRNKQKVGA